MPSLRNSFVLLGLILLSTGLPLIGNALFAQEPAVFWSGAQLRYYGSAELGYDLFLKPTDRFTFTLTSTLDQTDYSMLIVRVSDGSLVGQANQTAASTFTEQFTPKERGVYFLEINVSSAKNESFGLSQSYTIFGGKPTDLLLAGVSVSLVGAVFLLSSFLMTVSGRFRRKPNNRVLTPARRLSSSTLPRLMTLMKWELFTTKKLLFSFLILVAIMYSGGGFIPNAVSLDHIAPTQAPFWNVLDPSNIPTKDWITLFPVVVALAAYTFSYEKDNLTLRSVMLNPVSAQSVFLAKLVSMTVVFLIPISVAFALILSLFDPALLSVSPLMVLHNLWIWVCLYLLYGFVMIMFSILPAVLFRKSVYAIVVPLFISFLVETEGFGIQSYLPSNVWLNHAVGPLTSDTGTFNWAAFLSSAGPSLLLGVLLLATAFALFTSGNKE